VNKVKVGFFSFTEVTDPAEHRAYNEWHQLDHMPEQFPLRGIVFGQRWVSTPACRAARAVSGPRLDPIHYVTLYLMTDPIEETLHEFYALGRHLHEVDRFHRHRRALLSGPLRFVDAVVAPRVLISPEAVPYRPNRGVYVQVGGEPALDRWCALPGVAGAWAFADDEQRITVAWLDDTPLGVAGAFARSPGDDVELAGPFETIVPWKWDWFD
jgi:hypothetical protein